MSGLGTSPTDGATLEAMKKRLDTKLDALEATGPRAPRQHPPHTLSSVAPLRVPLHRRSAHQRARRARLPTVRRIEARGRYETARRTLAACSRVTGRAQYDGAGSTDRSVLVPVQARSFPAILNPDGIGQLLRALDGYVGMPETVIALKLAPLLFVRPGSSAQRSGPSSTSRHRRPSGGSRPRR